ncbi:Uma2 family endonuclease [Kovacikia minuta CCNUW1]|uniref:Uma2 family endonuclease n=1 Tax=Kovacikia minuta TaxID=2931930 RepID=UPI001CCAB94E|nr:Uma2 family endonuclease [Kovacikia minuta]UBF26264.1 Uma2 family endonuclease [Kovacikia minuta CCNUW1]
MTETTQGTAPVFYPESDGQPMTESDPTRDYLIYCVETLEIFFQGRKNVYVSGNLFIYYREGDPKKSISPDVFVTFGVSKRKRRSYKAWQEGGKLPSFVLEITSLSTRKQDEVEKPKLYAELGIQEYFQYDPTRDYLNPQLKGARLTEGRYQSLPLEHRKDGTPFIHSQTLGLDLILQTPTVQASPVQGLAPLPLELRFYDPQTDTKLLNYRELDLARERAEQERTEAEQARERAEQERTEAEQARERAEQERTEAVPRLLAMGLTVEQVAGSIGLFG